MEVTADSIFLETARVPRGWNVDRIGNLASITTGTKNTQDRISGGKYPFFVRSQKVERINSYSFDGEAILTAGDGVGTGKVFHYIKGKFDFHQRVYKLSNFRLDIDGYFLYLYFSNNFYNRIMQMTAKSSVDSVRMEMISEMPIPIPPKAEQTAIATALSDTDALISSLEKLIAKKRNIKQGVMQELFTPKSHWEFRTLQEIGEVYGGLSGKTKTDFQNGNCKYIPFMNIMRNTIIDLKDLASVKVGKGEAQNTAQSGDLFFNGSSETPEEVGLCSVLLQQVDNLYLNSFCFGFRLRKEINTQPLYLAYFFRSPAGRSLFFSLAQGATRYNLSKSNFLKLNIPLPKETEQIATVNVLKLIELELLALTNKKAKLQKLKTSMMQSLLTGKIRLV